MHTDIGSVMVFLSVVVCVFVWVLRWCLGVLFMVEGVCIVVVVMVGI